MLNPLRTLCPFTLAALALAGAVTLPSCSHSGHNSAPRVGTIPAQTATSAAMFSLDVAGYVTDDADGGTVLVYEVVSGGGSFTGSVYSRQFPTLGTYTVEFAVADAHGKRGTGSFSVKITQATLVVVQRGTNLSLVDQATGNIADASNAPGQWDTFRAATSRGAIVYERTVGTQTDLYLYDLNVPQTFTIGADAVESEAYVGKTSADLILFTRGTSTDRDLLAYDPASHLTTVISDADGEDESNVFVNASDLVFYQRQSGGQDHVWYWNPATETSTAVSTAATNEVIRALLPDGGIVFSRVGAGGENDLYYFKVGTGLVEIGADREATIGALNKAYSGRTSDSRVVFTTHDGTDFDLWIWNPANGQTAAVAGTPVDDTLAAVTANDKLIVNVATSPTDNDLYRYTPSTGTALAIAASGSNEVFNATLSDSDVVYTVDTGAGGKDVVRWDDGSASIVSSLTAGSTDYVFRAVLVNDKVVVSNSGSGLFLLTATGSTTVSADTTAAWAGETSGGDFVFTRTVSAQTDLYLWDESAATAVTISDNAAGETFGLGLTDGRVLYSRMNGSQTDLFSWSPVSGTSTQVTSGEQNESAVSVFTGNNP